MPSRRTMAPVCWLRLPRCKRRPFIWSNTLRTCHWMAPKPCWLMRSQNLDGRRVGAPANEGWLAGPESGARPWSLHLNECRHDAHRDDGQGAHRLDARGATSSLPAAPQASTEVLPAGSRDEGIRRRDMRPLLWQCRTDSVSTCGECREASRPCAHRVSVDVSHPR